MIGLFKVVYAGRLMILAEYTFLTNNYSSLQMELLLISLQNQHHTCYGSKMNFLFWPGFLYGKVKIMEGHVIRINYHVYLLMC